ncbi:MAG: rhomboid family intramembrane serine protease, partial [Flavobacteriaceae bacterium]|nr:rhomboid family intramembrane serine protease [Flavobacteriaceae bacterium]
FGGAIGGYALTIILASWVLQENFMMVVLLAIPIVLLIYLHKQGKV